jgi:hypothetical protein
MILGDLTLHAPLTLGRGISLTVQGFVRGTGSIVVSSESALRLTTTATNALATTASITAMPRTESSFATVILGSGFNGGVLWGNVFGNANTPFLGLLRIEGTMTLSSPLIVGTTGTFDFSEQSSNKLILTTSATFFGEILNQSPTRFFVNAPAPLILGNLGSRTFFIGSTITVCNPLVITNNGIPATFSARVLPVVSQLPPIATGSLVHRMSIVNRQWNVSQLNNNIPGASVSLSQLWMASQEDVGFNRSVAVSLAYQQLPVFFPARSAISTAITDPIFSNYFRHAVTITQQSKPFSDMPVLVASQPRPAIITYTPTSQSSGNTIRIIGNRFVSGAAVALGGVNVPAANISLKSGDNSFTPDTLAVIIPINGGPLCGTQAIVVIQIGGSASIAGIPCPFIITPNIFSITPNPVPGGRIDALLTIRGRNFGMNTPRVIAERSGLTATLLPLEHSSTSTTVRVPGYVIRNEGNLRLTVTSVERAPVETTVNIRIVSSVHQSTALNLNNLAIFPNPASNLILCEFFPNDFTPVEFQILDVLGRALLQKREEAISRGKQETTLDVSNLANGMYLLRMTQGTQHITRRFSVSR